MILSHVLGVHCTIAWDWKKNDDTVDDENNDDSGNNGLIMVPHHWWVSFGFFFTFVFSSEPADLMTRVCSLYATNLCWYFAFVQLYLRLSVLYFYMCLCLSVFFPSPLSVS